jgi:hypothetical protein
LSEALKDTACELLVQSLIAWRLIGSVRRTSDGSILVACNAKEICVAPASPDGPFRWTVTVDGRKRAAISLVAVLRQVREALDPGYSRNKVRVAVTSLVPS